MESLVTETRRAREIVRKAAAMAQDPGLKASLIEDPRGVWQQQAQDLFPNALELCRDENDAIANTAAALVYLGLTAILKNHYRRPR